MEEISETCNLSPAFISSLHPEYSTFLSHLDSLKQIQVGNPLYCDAFYTNY